MVKAIFIWLAPSGEVRAQSRQAGRAIYIFLALGLLLMFYDSSPALSPFLWVLGTWVSVFCAPSIIFAERSSRKQPPSSFARNNANEPYRALVRYLDIVIPSPIEKRSILLETASRQEIDLLRRRIDLETSDSHLDNIPRLRRSPRFLDTSSRARPIQYNNIWLPPGFAGTEDLFLTYIFHTSINHTLFAGYSSIRYTLAF